MPLNFVSASPVHSRSHQGGFTLIEVLVSVVILAIG
ncbi:MAG: prepilin-type N-terminal cleavage/methylation domain-containing protein, partial [Candidatus Sedimenticola sp. 6PFRAG1]